MKGFLSRIVIIFLVFAATLPCSCAGDKSASDTDRGLTAMKKFWHDKLSEGQMDSVVYITREYHKSIKGKSVDAEVLSGLQLAQAYTILENRDSADYYLNASTSLIDSSRDPMTKLLFHHIKGTLALKYRLDYPEALGYFHQGYREARKADNRKAMVTMLSNIGYIYYILNDPHGMEYALEAVNLVSKYEKDPLYSSQAYMGLALMQATNHMYHDALATLDHTDSLISGNRLKQLAPLSYATRGDILTRLGNCKEAEKYYEKAIRMLPYAEPSFGVLATMRYGIAKERQKEYHSADSLYRKALAFSTAYRNLEFRADILLALAKLHSHIGNKDDALHFFNRYHNFNDSLNKSRMVQDFNSLVTTNLRLEKENELQKYRISNLRTQRIATICVSLLTVLVIVIITMSMTHRKQRRLHDATVRRLLESNKINGAATQISSSGDNNASAPADSALEEIFRAIDRKMKEDKAYRDRNISLESVAVSLDSNRTYISKAVNAYAGVSFSRYVNTFRIQEALAILSDPDGDIRVKEIAAQVGFSSDSVLSKTFKKEVGMSPMEFRKSAISIAKEC